jgi:hypothetical protein
LRSDTGGSRADDNEGCTVWFRGFFKKSEPGKEITEARQNFHHNTATCTNLMIDFHLHKTNDGQLLPVVR